MNIKKLDKVIKNIWLEDIKDDYEHNLILNEDTLKNALYFHLRTYFENTPEFYDLCIFTECTDYGFSSLSYRPDMIIVNTKTDEIVAVWIEFSSDDTKSAIGTADGEEAYIELTNTSVSTEEHTYLKLNDFSPSANSELIEGVIWAVPKATSGEDLDSGIPLFEIVYE